jgi:malate/lactate dehydrogenase
VPRRLGVFEASTDHSPGIATTAILGAVHSDVRRVLKCIAYVPGQRDKTGKEHAVAYGGRGLRPNEEKWPVTLLE